MFHYELIQIWFRKTGHLRETFSHCGDSKKVLKRDAVTYL